MRLAALVLLIVALTAAPAGAHDPSAWGGSFRSRDGGSTWTPIDAGLFIGGAVMLAIDPNDPNHILYATDARMLRSHNGGRDWVQEPSGTFMGPTLAVAFSSTGESILAATAAGVFRTDAGGAWQAANVPAAVNPVSTIVAGMAPGRFYVLGVRGVYRSDDSGATWIRCGEALQDAPLSGLAVARDAPETVAVIAAGRVYASTDTCQNWQSRSTGSPDGKVETLASDTVAGRLWAAGADRIYRSDTGGQAWQAQGQPLPEPGINVRGIAASADAATIVLTTHRGLYRSANAGESWALVEGNVPVHLEAGPLVRDSKDPATLYAGFSLTPYSEIRRRAQEGSNLLAQVDVVSLAGGGAFLVLLAVAAVYVVRRLWRASLAAAAAPTTNTTRTR
jgi:photosystem II stability/assembly factor-like uncharacterized protein